MYTITTFVAKHIPTRYESPAGGGAAIAVGTETVTEYETYDACKSKLASYSNTMANEKKENAEKKESGEKVIQKVWTSYKMYSEAKQPSLLHYIDNNYPGIRLEKI